MAFLAFLASARSRLSVALAAHRPLTLVTGNEAADADSVLSALCYGFLLASRPGQTREIVPVVSCRANEFALRREVTYLLERAAAFVPRGPGAGLEDAYEGLAFLDDVESRLSALRVLAAADGGLQVALLDHNAAWGPFAELAPCVSEILDHHKDARLHPHVAGLQRSVSFNELEGRGVGSTCTLVAQRLLQRQQQSGGGGLPAADAAQLSLLLLGVILLDTINLSAAAGKTTAEDAATAAALQAALATAVPAAGAAALDTLFDALAGIRMDPAWWRALPVPLALKYDFKQLNVPQPQQSAGAASGAPRQLAIGTSAICMSITDFLAPASASAALPPAPLGGPGAPVRPAAVDASRLRSAAGFAAAAGLDLLVLVSFAAGKRQVGALVPPPPPQAAALAGVGAAGDPTATSVPAPWGAGVPASIIAELAREPALRLERVDLTVVAAAAETAGEGCEGGPELLVFDQGNAVASRKQILPMLGSIASRLLLPPPA